MLVYSLHVSKTGKQLIADSLNFTANNNDKLSSEDIEYIYDLITYLNDEDNLDCWDNEG